MGRSGIAMTLLSTLAALVIIVHTAEEEYERAQRGLRARSLEVEVPNYEQAWRALDVNPKLPETPHNNAWKDETPEDIPKRRRGMRKRKRRPQMVGSGDHSPQERHVYHGDVLPRNQEYFVTPPETTRRRKKINRQDLKEQGDADRWGDQIDVERPARRRGRRRKRPTNTDSWPRLSEFGGFRSPAEVVPEENVWSNRAHESMNEDTNTSEQENNDEVEEKRDRLPIDFDTNIGHEDTPEEMVFNTATPQTLPINKDRSMSEFSLETLIKPRSEGNFKPSREKVKEKTTNSINQREKALQKENKPLEPQALKAILKRSNGRSLSEILQQNNLSLSDLLQGREKALSLLKTDTSAGSYENDDNNNNVKSIDTNDDQKVNPSNEYKETMTPTATQQRSDDKEVNETETHPVTEYLPTTIADTNDEISQTVLQKNIQNDSNNVTYDQSESTTQNNLRRRFPFHIRRKFRNRPFNNTFKGQLSRDIVALNTRKYKNNRHMPISKEWTEFMPANTKTRKLKIARDEKAYSNDNSNTENNDISTTIMEEETTHYLQETDNTDAPTTQSNEVIINSNTFNNAMDSESFKVHTKDENELETTMNDEILPTTTPAAVTEKIVTITQKPRIPSHMRSTLNASELRRQAFNNRLNKKRMKQKKLSSKSPQEAELTGVFDMANMVSASEFIAKPQQKTTNAVDENNMTTLDDSTVTESVPKQQTRVRSTNSPNLRSSILPKIQPYLSVTENTAKFEIEEIFNDTMSRARISKILKERNMTLNELVQHRERGSSHIHLADIFHNASKEPNPPEPFLSKSLIEPISKETYPLRALLEANLHDPKANIDLNALNSNYLNIPVVMDFGNNVNENGENMGIMSLFSNKNMTDPKPMNSPDLNAPSDNEEIDNQKGLREGRKLDSDKGLFNWNDIIKLLHDEQNKTASDEIIHPRVSSKSETIKGILLEDDVNGDGVIVFEDLQHLKDNNIASSNEENIEVKIMEKVEDTPTRPIFNASSNARSVTVVTASIIGLALVLFLLTYAAFKWKQQSKIIENKQCTKDERIPSPVFENRAAKHNSSTRSKSPMLTSNIYSINTLDTHAGAESPDYMWDSLRKPFQ